MTKNKKKSKVTAVAITEIDEQEDELIEKRFKELLREEKDIEIKEIMKQFDIPNPNDYTLLWDLAKAIRRVFLRFVIIILELRKQRDEARQKLMAYQKG